MVTEMWDDWDLKAARHRQTFDHPDLYDFVDVSQNNHNRGQQHWDNFLFVRDYLSKQPRPMNTTKTYGADGNKFKHTDQDAIERFWRHLLAGAASIRFHRPDSGLGINDKAVACIRAARMLEEKIAFWDVTPANEILDDRDHNEAYAATSEDKKRIATYFPAAKQAGRVTIDLGNKSQQWNVHWINIDVGKSLPPEVMQGGHEVELIPPGPGNFAVAIVAAN